MLFIKSNKRDVNNYNKLILEIALELDLIPLNNDCG